MFLFPLLAAIGVLTENFVFFASFIILKTNVYPSAESVHIVIKQVISALLTGSFIPGLLCYTYKLWSKWLKNIFEEEDNN